MLNANQLTQQVQGRISELHAWYSQENVNSLPVPMVTIGELTAYWHALTGEPRQGPQFAKSLFYFAQQFHTPKGAGNNHGFTPSDYLRHADTLRRLQFKGISVTIPEKVTA